MAISFPNISPVAYTFEQINFLGYAVGPFELRWYALAYVVGFLLAWGHAYRLNNLYGSQALRQYKIDDFITWAILGVILGGRLGYVLFYNFDAYLADPMMILKVWEGGMSFHGGAVGVILALIIYSWASHTRLLQISDITCACVPIGLFLGRCANFVNAELYGRVAHDWPLAVIFPGTDGQPRHPSQLYEAAGEGVLLYLILGLMFRMDTIRDRPGIISGTFLIGYGAVRFMVEFVREPDSQLGTLSMGLTMGQLLCLPMFLLGLGVIAFSWRRLDT
jgi:phosphatidylglycerol---prolipoprotein diacylglyceryl transferase